MVDDPALIIGFARAKVCPSERSEAFPPQPTVPLTRRGFLGVTDVAFALPT